MATRQRRWAAKAAEKLKIELGGKCATPDCGETDLSRLQFDHLFQRDWEPDETEFSHRISIYRREAKAGLLQLLCGTCNAKKGKPKFAFGGSEIPE